MTITTENPSGFDSENGGWSGTGNLLSSNDVCCSIASASGAWVIVDFDFSGVPDTDVISKLRLRSDGHCGDNGAAPYNDVDHSFSLRINEDGDNTDENDFCPGHSMGIVGSPSCGASFVASWQTCTHTDEGKRRPNTGAELKLMKMMARINSTGSDTCYMDTFIVEVTHAAPPTYSHDVIGVAAAGVEKISGVLSTDIEAVVGVAT